MSLHRDPRFPAWVCISSSRHKTALAMQRVLDGLPSEIFQQLATSVFVLAPSKHDWQREWPQTFAMPLGSRALVFLPTEMDGSVYPYTKHGPAEFLENCIAVEFAVALSDGDRKAAHALAARWGFNRAKGAGA